MIDKKADFKKNEKKIEFQTLLNAKLIDSRNKPMYSLWKKEVDVCEPLGIGLMNLAYIETKKTQDKAQEYAKIKFFLHKYMAEYADRNGVDANKLRLDYINYGKTELVYVLTEPSGKRVTILTKQPVVEFGKIRQETENLWELSKFDSKVVAPIEYYACGDQELYVTPYINQARCIASDNVWGMYVPEPFYRFERFSDKQEEVVNTCMIAKLISLYNFEKGKGIASCKLGGGDFMLPKDWEKESPTIENTLNNLYLISARDMINCSFEKYQDIIRKEFSKCTINENQDEILLNHRGRVAMQPEHIESGIALGKQLIIDRINEKNH